ncbi:hypothetical protein [Rhizobium phaseoli]|uniref:hypothetical protein n=1 Tax=Rhizobium phaseoli TaxID=396 RepID=UPI001680AE1F|nr:hypothetical protein [Rhizobium phaseoli]
MADGAARWLAAQTDHMPNVISILRQKFGLSAVQAAQACTLANKHRIEARQLQTEIAEEIEAPRDRHVTSLMSRDLTNVTSVTNSADSMEFHEPLNRAAPLSPSEQQGAA